MNYRCCAFIGPREAWVSLLLCASTLQFVCLLFASARLILEPDSKDLLLLFLFPPLFSCLFAFLFLLRLRCFFLHRVELLGRIKNSGRWIGLNTNFKEWNGDVERICNFAKMLTWRIFFSPRIFEFSEFFFSSRKENRRFYDFPFLPLFFFFFVLLKIQSDPIHFKLNKLM